MPEAPQSKYRLWRERTIIGISYFLLSVLIFWLGWGGGFFKELILQMGSRALFCTAAAFLGLGSRAIYMIKFGRDSDSKDAPRLLLGYLLVYPLLILLIAVPLIFLASSFYTDEVRIYLASFALSFAVGFYTQSILQLIAR